MNHGERGREHAHVFRTHPNVYASAAGPVDDDDQPNLFVVFNDLLSGRHRSDNRRTRWASRPALEYQRGPGFRLTADRPNFPVWAASDPAILRVYQDDALVDIIRNDAQNIDHTNRLDFRVTVPELRDPFDGTKRLVAIIANPWYARRVFGQQRTAQPVARLYPRRSVAPVVDVCSVVASVGSAARR